MDILLIQPPKPAFGSNAESYWTLTRPTSLFFLAAAIKKYTAFTVGIIDFESRAYHDKNIEEVLRSRKVRVFGITAVTFTRFEAIGIARLVKKIYPDAFVVMGGVHFSFCAEDTLQRVSAVDAIVRGEGEIPLVNLLQILDRGGDLSAVKGLSFRQNGTIIHNPEQNAFENLDELPVYKEFNWEEYPEYLFGIHKKVKAVSVIASRGCPYHCIFCSKAGMKYRLRNVESVVDEMEYMKGTFDINGINFLDLTFTANPLHLKALCTEIKRRKVNLQWWCESRANIPIESLEWMKQAGCVALVIGVESGSPTVLKRISKEISLEQVKIFCSRAAELGITVQPYLMFSHPDETMEDVKKSQAFMAELEKTSRPCSFQPTMIFPGTEIEKIALAKNIIPPGFSWNEPYFSELNIELGQLSNIPLFIDRLSPNEMRRIQSNRAKQVARSQSALNAASLTASEAVAKAWQVIRERRSTIRYFVSPSFLRTFISAKWFFKKK
jgi:anaerobic magnesium-protoporphyrin IX monomethyl ester cyclase